MNVTTAEWDKIQEWAEAQLRAEGTPWAGYQYMKLIDAIDSIRSDHHYRQDEEWPESETVSHRESSDAQIRAMDGIENEHD